MIRKFVLVLMAVIGVNALQAAENDLKPRLVVCTDIAPADVEPDDMESMVRLMAYADAVGCRGQRKPKSLCRHFERHDKHHDFAQSGCIEIIRPRRRQPAIQLVAAARDWQDESED